MTTLELLEQFWAECEYDELCIDEIFRWSLTAPTHD